MDQEHSKNESTNNVNKPSQKGFLRRALGVFKPFRFSNPSVDLSKDLMREQLYVAIAKWDSAMELKRQGRLLPREVQSASKSEIEHILNLFSDIPQATEALINGNKIDDETESFKFKIKEIEFDGIRSLDDTQFAVTKRYSKGDSSFIETITLSPTIYKYEERIIKKDSSGKITSNTQAVWENTEEAQPKIAHFVYEFSDYRIWPLRKQEWTRGDSNAIYSTKRNFPWSKNSF